MNLDEIWNSKTFIDEYTNRYCAITDWNLGYKFVTNNLGDIKDKKILDYGCGTGKFARFLSRNESLVDAVDVSLTSIEKAKNISFSNIDYRKIESANLSHILDKSMDYTVINFVLCQIRDSSEIEEILKSIRQKLVSNGRLVILEPNPDSVGFDYISMKRDGLKIESYPIKVSLNGVEQDFRDYWRSKNTHLNLFERAGYKINSLEEPTINNNDFRFSWKDEKFQAPHIIYSLTTT